MSKFVVNTDMFGCYVKIPYGHYFEKTGEKHIYKVITRFQSNTWCEAPITYQSENNPIIHDYMEDVLNVIHCGVDETKVIRVSLKDCELIES